MLFGLYGRSRGLLETVAAFCWGCCVCTQSTAMARQDDMCSSSCTSAGGKTRHRSCRLLEKFVALDAVASKLRRISSHQGVSSLVLR